MGARRLTVTHCSEESPMEAGGQWPTGLALGKWPHSLGGNLVELGPTWGARIRGNLGRPWNSCWFVTQK